jgi:ubiquinone/menaquinone biosynthesis C-methylase UbiE
MKEYYDRRAPEYDDWWLGTGMAATRVRLRPGWEEDRQELFAAVEELPPRRTLDVACGTGFLTEHLPGEVVGLDHSERMLQIARARVPDAEFVQGDGLELPFENASFERVFSSYFYCHLEEDERLRFLDEACRVALELVLVASVLWGGVEPERWEERVLSDGTRWQVYKRYFEPESLAAEIGGDVYFQNQRFVVVRA